MTVFKYFFKVLNKYKVPVIIYTVFLIVFGVFSLQTSESATNFVASKPSIVIINKDDETGITKNLIDYIKDNSNVKNIPETGDNLNDALFYRDVNYIVYIPENYRHDFLNGKTPEIKVRSTGDYMSTYSEMLLNRYVNIASVYQKDIINEDEIIKNINKTLSNQTEIELTSKLNTNALSKVAFYYNFANYSILAGCIYVICLILSTFREDNIRKRTLISSMNYKKHNRILLISNGIFAFALWSIYVILSCVLLKDAMFTINGLYYILNSFIFTICALTMAILIGNLFLNKNAINGIVNVVALGSSFLCGAFVPMQWLPDVVLKIAHLLPSYWYIKSNELLKSIELFNLETLKPIIINMGILLIFAIIFIFLTNIVSKNKTKIN